MKKVFLIMCVCLCTFCSKKKTKIPEGLYSKEQMAVFLKDLYLLESKIKELKLKKDSAKVIYDYYEKQLYAKHNMSDSIYRESFKYFVEDVDQLNSIYGIITDSLSLEERMIVPRKDTTESKK